MVTTSFLARTTSRRGGISAKLSIGLEVATKAYFLRDTFVPSVRCHHHTVPCPQAATSHVQGRDIRFTLYATYLCHPVSPRTSSYWYSSYSYAIPVGGKYGEAATLHPLKADAHPRKATVIFKYSCRPRGHLDPKMFQQSVRIIFACLFVTGALVSDPATCTTTIPEEVRCAIGALLLGSASEADDESTGPERIIRAANRHRDRETWKENSAQMSGKKFRKRFKVSRQRFSSLADLIAPHVEPDSIGKMMAEISSGSYIPSEVYLAVTSRWLSGSHFSDLEDLYGVEENGAYTVVWKTLAVLDKKLKLNDFNPWDLGQCKALAQKMYIRSKQTIAGCIGALDGMAVRIYKPRNSDAENSLHFLNRKGFLLALTCRQSLMPIGNFYGIAWRLQGELMTPSHSRFPSSDARWKIKVSLKTTGLQEMTPTLAANIF